MGFSFKNLFRFSAKTPKPTEQDEERAGTMQPEQPPRPDRVEVENAIAGFKELISRLSQNGAEIGEMYLSAERKATRYALLSENVIESVTSGILVVDGVHEICLANSSAKRILGCDENFDLAGRQLKALFEEHRQLESLVAEGLRSSRNAFRKVINVTLHGGASLCLGVSTSCVASDKSRPEAVIVVFTQLDRDATGMISGQAGRQGAAAEAYRKGMLDAYAIVSEIYTEIDGVRSEIESGEPDPTRLAGAAERVGYACDLMMGFALSKAASNAMTELVDLNGAVRSVLEAKGLSGRRIVARLATGLPRISTLRRVLDAGLEMLIRGCVAESSDGVEIITRLEGPLDQPTVTLSVAELSPTLPLVEVGEGPRGFLEGAGLRREMGLMLLKSLPARSHRTAASRDGGSFTYSVAFLLPKLKKEGEESTSGGFTDSDSSDGETG
jgi:PAS domain-containing protein